MMFTLHSDRSFAYSFIIRPPSLAIEVLIIGGFPPQGGGSLEGFINGL